MGCCRSSPTRSFSARVSDRVDGSQPGSSAACPRGAPATKGRNFLITNRGVQTGLHDLTTRSPFGVSNQVGGAPKSRDAEDAAAPDGATREMHAARPDGRARVGGLRAGRRLMLRGTAFMESGVPWAVPLTSDASAETKSRTAHRTLRRYRVLRGRAVRRGSAPSASRLFGAPPAWSAHRQTSQPATRSVTAQDDHSLTTGRPSLVRHEPRDPARSHHRETIPRAIAEPLTKRLVMLGDVSDEHDRPGDASVGADLVLEQRHPVRH